MTLVDLAGTASITTANRAVASLATLSMVRTASCVGGAVVLVFNASGGPLSWTNLARW